MCKASLHKAALEILSCVKQGFLVLVFLFVLVLYFMCKASLFWYFYLFLYDIIFFYFVQANLPYFNQKMFLMLSSLYYNFK